VNDTPKSSKVIQDSQVWEFSHPKFIRGRTDILTDIKRRVVSSPSGGSSATHSRSLSETDEPMVNRKERDELLHQLTTSKALYSETVQHLHELQSSFHIMIKEIGETKRKQSILQEGVKKMIDVLNNQQAVLTNGTAKPFELQDFGLHELDTKPFDANPSPLIYVSSSDQAVAMKPEVLDFELGDGGMYPYSAAAIQQGQLSALSQVLLRQQQQMAAFPPQLAFPNFIVPQAVQYVPMGTTYAQQPKLAVPSQYPAGSNPNHQRSGSYNTAVNTPLPPSPIISPVGSPGYQSSLSDNGEDDFMEPVSPEEGGEWSQEY